MDQETMIVEPGHENPAADALNGVYEKHRQMRLGDKILDLGAHAGYFSMVAHERIGTEGKIYAFEPHPDNYKKLLMNCPFATCVNSGAWDEDTVQPLWQSVDNSGGHSFWKVEVGQKETPIMCNLVDIGRWLEMANFAPDFVKIDTELSEFRILTSLMRTKLRPEIAAEIHNQEMWDKCCALLKDKGYQMTPDKFTNYYLYAWVPKAHIL